MRFILLSLLLIAIPLTAQAQRFPYQSDVFFRDCTHLRDARHDEPADLYDIDLGCSRYIEGFEMGYISGGRLPRTCMADPLSIFNAAETMYLKDKNKDYTPVRYLGLAVNKLCKRQ